MAILGLEGEAWRAAAGSLWGLGVAVLPTGNPTPKTLSRDVDAVVLRAQPQDPAEATIAAVESYLRAGVSVVYCLSPSMPEGSRTAFARHFTLEVDPTPLRQLVDGGTSGEGTTSIRVRFTGNPVGPAFLENCCCMQRNGGRTWRSLAVCDTGAWRDTNRNGIRNLNERDATGLPVVMATDYGAKARLVVIGSESIFYSQGGVERNRAACREILEYCTAMMGRCDVGLASDPERLGGDIGIRCGRNVELECWVKGDPAIPSRGVEAILRVPPEFTVIDTTGAYVGGQNRFWVHEVGTVAPGREVRFPTLLRRKSFDLRYTRIAGLSAYDRCGGLEYASGKPRKKDREFIIRCAPWLPLY